MMQLAIFLVLYKVSKYHGDYVELNLDILNSIVLTGGITKVLTQEEPNILFQNWGPSLDGAAIVTGILDIGGRDVAVYGHDFTLRAGSMDATNGAKLARLIYMAG